MAKTSCLADMIRPPLAVETSESWHRTDTLGTFSQNADKIPMMPPPAFAKPKTKHEISFHSFCKSWQFISYFLLTGLPFTKLQSASVAAGTAGHIYVTFMLQLYNIQVSFMGHLCCIYAIFKLHLCDI